MKTKRNEILVTALATSLAPIADGTVTSTGDVFNDNLPEGITPKTVEELAHYTGEFIAAGTEAIGAVAIKALSKDKKLDKVTGEFGIGALGNVAVNVERSREGVKPGTTEKTVTYGANRVITSFQPGDKVGALSAAQSEIKKLAKEALAKD